MLWFQFSKYRIRTKRRTEEKISVCVHKEVAIILQPMTKVDGMVKAISCRLSVV